MGADGGRSAGPVALGVALAVVVAGTAAIHWPLPLHLRTAEAVGAFHPGHTWGFAHVARMLVGDASSLTAEVGFPNTHRAAFLAWVPAVLVAPLQGVLGPVGAYNVAVLLSPALAAAAAWVLLRSVARAPAWVAAAGAAAWALSPYVVGCLASGQTCKAQVWVLPAALAAFHRAIGPDARLVPSVSIFLAVLLAGAFTEPSYTLHLGPALGLWWLLAALEGPSRGRRLLRGGLALALAAAVLALPYLYYAPGAGGTGGEVFQPARRPGFEGDLVGAVAALDTTFVGRVDAPVDPRSSVHVTYLPAPLVLGGLLLGWWGGPAGRVGLLLASVGMIVAMGERLAWDGQLVRVDGRTVPLPMAWLAHYGYPLAKSGMYYRAVALAGLGLTLAAAAGLARLGEGRRRALWIAGGVAIFGLTLADTARVVDPLMPRPVQPIPSLAAWARMRADPAPGAVLDLPLGHDGYGGQVFVRGAALHGRPTNGLPRAARLRERPDLVPLELRLAAALRSADPAGAIAALGFRYVVWHANVPPEGGPTREDVAAALGPGERDADGVVWRLPAPEADAPPSGAPTRGASEPDTPLPHPSPPTAAPGGGAP